MKGGFRQSMAWLHTWSGLLLGWLLFAVFLTGTLSYYRTEITYWMQPELHGTQPGRSSLEIGLASLAQLAPDAAWWAIALPDERSRALQVSWSDKPGGGRRDAEHRLLDAGTGMVLTPRQTAGGEFLYRFHFELYALPRDWARWIVGTAAMMMLVAIVSGIVTHKRIFSDIFTFRPRKGQRSWLDAHAVVAVLPLPFHLMITYSGLLLVATTLLPWNAEERRRQRDADPPAVLARAPLPAPLPASLPASLPLPASLAPLLADAKARWGMPAGRILVRQPGRPDATVELAPRRNRELTAASGSGSVGVERLTYLAATGELQSARAAPQQNPAQAAVNLMGTLHRARFAGPPLRWLFFLSGLAGTAMVGSGLVLWTVKRSRDKPQGFSRRLVSALNIAGIAGLLCATGTYFAANRLLSPDLPARPQWEIAVFFLTWLASLLLAFAMPDRRGWTLQLRAAAVLLLLLPLLDAAASPDWIARVLQPMDLLVLGFDLVSLLLGLLLLGAARWVARGKAPIAPGPRRTTAQRREGAG